MVKLKMTMRITIDILFILIAILIVTQNNTEIETGQYEPLTIVEANWTGEEPQEAEEVTTEIEPIVEEVTTIEEKTEQQPSAQEIRLLSAIVWAEAGNQCEAGQQAVGIVVMNRVESDLFPNTISEVLYQSGQFSPAKDGSLSRGLSMYDSNSLPSSCIEAAYYAYNGNKTVSYNGNTYNLSGYYFFSRRISNAKLTIQNHQFK